MNSGKKFIAFLLFGIYLSIGTGIALFIAGGITTRFALCIIGAAVLGGGTFLTIATATTIYVVRNIHEHRFDYEPQISAPVKKEMVLNEPKKDITYLMNKEEEFKTDLELHYKIELLWKYQAEVKPIWDRYTGEAWDENLEEIDSIIDKYKAME